MARVSATPKHAARLSATILLFCFTAFSADEPFAAYLHRIGPYRVGMTLADMRRVMGDPGAKLKELEGPQCSYLSTTEDYEGLAFMFSYGRLVRIDVDGPGIPTASGVQVGDSEEKVLRTYPGRIKVQPHKYGDKDDHYLVFETKDPFDRDYGLVFETFGGEVTTYRIGTKEAITLVEGCA